MAYARPFSHAQGASPWSSGVPPGLQQQQQAQQQVQPMFNQPMGAFDISGAWQGQQAGAQQWVPAQPMQQVQFVPNPAFMQVQPHRQPIQQQQQLRPMHQRSLSAPRIGVNGLKKQANMNQSGSFGGQQQQQHWQNRPQHQNNQYQQRVTRQQSRMNNQKGHFNNNSNNTNNNVNNNRQQNQQQKQQQQQQQQPANKQQQQAVRKGPVKVTKVKKQVALKAKHKVAASGNKVDKDSTQNGSAKFESSDEKPKVDATAADATDQPPVKAQSKTAERKQLKLQARKNAESLTQSKLPVAKSARVAGEAPNGDESKADEPIEQAQLKCVPAVFGFVCKLCDVFLRDKIARREHIDSAEHLEKFKVFEEKEKEAAEAQALASNPPEPEIKPEPETKPEPVETPSQELEVKKDETDAAS